MPKNKCDNEMVGATDISVKKTKLFSAKEFRKQLNTDGLNSLKQFLQIVEESKDHDYIFDYLESGGNCLELLHCLEVDSSIPPAIVLEIITHILLQIHALYPQYQSSAYEACRYILNNYVTVLKKMISLSSTTPERKSCLKLLTAMVTFSPILAKDILIHVNFHSANVELLTKHTGEKNSTRDNFIQFLTAYLVDGHYPALSVLLEKKGFLTGVITGLKFDSAETLCLVISAMKNYILENPLVSKTVKMKTFNTIVVKDIVNLYNWKGPAGFRAEKKNNVIVTVDEIEKAKVSECVHDFLLTLCTNHKIGVIFKDHLVGFGKKNQNALMFTVLESLDRPWGHSYASELVTKICGACPDLAKTLWSNLKSFLEPRLSEKWVNAIKFSVNLIKEFQPSCIDYCIKELNEMQFFQVVQGLVLPLSILKTLLPENNSYERPAVKQYVLSLLLEMLKMMQEYIVVSEKYLNPEKRDKFKLLLNKYINKYFPNAAIILNNWEDPDGNSPFTKTQILEIIFDIFNHYKIVSLELLEPLKSIDTELSDLLNKIKQFDEPDELLETLQVKIISIFVDLEQTNLTTNFRIFEFIVPLLLKIYYKNVDLTTLDVLRKLFKSTTIFDGCLYEINIWINGVLDLKHFDEHLGKVIVEILNITYQNMLQYREELTLIQSETEKHYKENNRDLFIQDDFVKKGQNQSNTYKSLSPLIVGLLTYSTENDVSKSFKVYVNFVLTNLLHLETQSMPIISLIDKFNIISGSLKEYASSWLKCKEVVILKKSKGRFQIFQDFSMRFLSGELEVFLEHNNLEAYFDLGINLLDISIFYVTNFLINNSLTLETAENFEKFAIYLIKRDTSSIQTIENVLSHPVLIYFTSFLEINKQTSQSHITNCLINITKYLLNEGCAIGPYLSVYREKLLHSILKILSKPQKYEQLDLKTVLHLYGLGYNECVTILDSLSETYKKYSEHELIMDVLSYSLSQFTSLAISNHNLDPLEGKVVLNLTSYLVTLAKNQIKISAVSSAIYDYLKKFPHSLNHIDSNLFKVLLELEETNKDNVKLTVFLLETNSSNMKYLRKNLQLVCEKKSLLLPVLTVLCKQQLDEELMQQIYDLTVTSLNKTLHKPQKVGQHFHESYYGLTVLINTAMPMETCKRFLDKVQKFDVTETFHAHLLKAVCLKTLDDSVSSKEINNSILIFVHLLTNLFKKNLKTDTDVSKAVEVSSLFIDLLKEIKKRTTDKDLKITAKNETMKLYFKFCLKYGVSKQPIFLQTLRYLLGILSGFLEVEDGRLVLEMLISHSEFLDIILGEYCDTKIEILSLYLVLCKTWPEFMERQYVPLLLASYRALVNKCDRIILLLLKMYESKQEQTHFYDFKPFLWDKAAATHYSVRQQLENALWRQPKVSDILDILQENLVHSTIINYPLKESLRSDGDVLLDVGDIKSYDLKFLLPLFSQLLAPEQQVQTYKFTRSGALSLAVVGLSSVDKETRQAACHVLARLHYHVDARQTGKDNLLWIRYIEAVCKGTALLPDFKLNNFSAIYLARMALILTRPNHVMYLPLSQHLTAKSSLNFSTVPELYTFLHSSDVNFKEHRTFTLKLLRDGLRTEKDFTDFVRSMAFKLFSELYSSVVSDLDTKLLILDVVKAICGIPSGVKVLCENYSFLTLLATDCKSLREEKNNSASLEKILEIIVRTLRIMQDRHTCFMIFGIVKTIVLSDLYGSLVNGCEKILFKILFDLQSKFSDLFSKEFCYTLIDKVNDPMCKYIVKYGCDFINLEELRSDGHFYHFRLFVINFKKLVL